MRVDVWIDLACPWCYIGKRRLERAIESLGDMPVEVVWRSFQLSPDAPRFGEPGAGELAEDYLARKFRVGVAGAREMNARVSKLAEAEGLGYRLDRARHVNTYDAHRLVQAAKEAGVADELVEALFRAQFIDGARLDDHTALRDLAEQAGMDRAVAARVLAGNEYGEAVQADIREAATRGAQGVPFFVIDGGFGITGAQPSVVLAERMRGAAAANEQSANAA